MKREDESCIKRVILDISRNIFHNSEQMVLVFKFIRNLSNHPL